MDNIGRAWEERLTRQGIFWFHDGNTKRPYARLTSGKISNGFFNGSLLCATPKLLEQAVKSLMHKTWSTMSIHSELFGTTKPAHRFDYLTVGPAMGGITLAHEVAKALGIGTVVAEKETGDTKRFHIPRLPPQDPPTKKILLIEDTITTGDSVLAVRHAVWKSLPYADIFPIVVAVCNRSGKRNLDDLHICALIDRNMPTWDEGQNPFTRDGKELVEPVKPKSNWDLLTKNY